MATSSWVVLVAHTSAVLVVGHTWAVLAWVVLAEVHTSVAPVVHTWVVLVPVGMCHILVVATSWVVLVVETWVDLGVGQPHTSTYIYTHRTHTHTTHTHTKCTHKAHSTHTQHTYEYEYMDPCVRRWTEGR